ncbi:NAD(P)H-hydrate dehydratase [Tropicimonas sp. TH_r6]|uniref:NAD(P)H-hydrate dehydratase n=1 Tax=Tropicimonas sp. TH_r6 TaxID=3082085 RepID=UPI002954A02B|nr:NAD(P)H-hydrate dehydratase [Tropicimonas sp. TH_r6]MDV7143804.1 NAD(P)H-hydrate dehydratase [Tropicimonas sp. TH_r6]
MTELLTSAQMRAIEQAAFNTGQASGLELMERAGAGVVAAIYERWPELAERAREAVVFCGPGNNGGDGFVIARLLRERGWVVQVFLYGEADGLRGDARENCARWRELGPVTEFADWALASHKAPDLVVDALFGTGLTRPLPQELDQALADFEAGLPEGAARFAAVDAPSGLCMDSGRVLERPGNTAGRLPLRQALTISFHTLKRGHVLAEGPEWCGEVQVADIGLKERELRRAEPGLVPVLKDMATLAAPRSDLLLKGGEETPRGHKYDYGHAIIVSGGPGRTGAARLAARAALRVGAGLVTLAAPGTAIAECAAQVTAIMLARCNGASELGALLEDERLNALCLGPALGVGAGTRDMVLTALGSRRRCVLDADALTSFAEHPPSLFAHLHSKVVLTPHMGEFARLFPDIADRLRAEPAKGPVYSKVDAVQEAAARAGCLVLLKGPDTVIAEPGGRAVVSAASYGRAAPWLATAGSGDVLAGLVTGLLARGGWPIDAAVTGAWLHVEAGRQIGPGLIAEDISEALPGVLRQLLS